MSAHLGRVVVVLSVGSSEDDVDELRAAVSELAQDGTCMYAVAYADAPAEVLKDSVHASSQQAGCGRFFEARQNSFELEYRLVQTYLDTASEEVFSVKIDIDTVDEVTFRFDISSNATQEQLSACFAPKTRVVITQNREIRFDNRTTSNSITAEGIAPGEYEYFVFTQETCDGSCVFTGTATGAFTIDALSRSCTPR